MSRIERVESFQIQQIRITFVNTESQSKYVRVLISPRKCGVFLETEEIQTGASSNVVSSEFRNDVVEDKVGVCTSTGLSARPHVAASSSSPPPCDVVDEALLTTLRLRDFSR